jgi:hypothetical protein
VPGQTTDAGANARTAPVNDQLSRAQITAAQTSAGQAAGDQSLATQPGAASAAGTQSLAAQTSGASAAGAQPVATPLSATRVAGAVAASAGQDRGQAAAPAAAATGASSAPRVLLDERFADNAHGWTNDSNGPATFSSGSYRLNARLPGQFVALGTPITDTLRDVVVGANFRKLSGPAGGGFGLIVRDQGPEPRDGVSQGGRYYVLEVGDKGEIGMWRRESDRWVDLLPWQHSDAVRTGTESNQIVARAVGDQLSLEVNGTQVGSVIDSTLAAGRIGLFVGGDQNQVSIDHLWVQAP